MKACALVDSTKKTKLASHALTSRAIDVSSCKGWSSDFPPLPSAFSSKRAMALMLRSHNGVHCCETVGDSHSRSQLSTVKCTFMGITLLLCAAKIQLKKKSPRKLGRFALFLLLFNFIEPE